MAAQPDLIPLWMNWSGRTVLIIGLGSVGQRRALTFLRADATIMGVDPMPSTEGPVWGELIREGLELRSEPYDASVYEDLELSGTRPDLVLACATREVNRVVIQEAISRRLWVASATNVEEESASANAHIGAVASGEFVSIAIHSGNFAPALSRSLREMIEMNWLTAADRLAREASRWRKVLMNSGIHPEKRRELLAAVGDPERLDEELRRSGAGVEALRSFLQESTHLEPEEPTTGKIMDDCP